MPIGGCEECQKLLDKIQTMKGSRRDDDREYEVLLAEEDKLRKTIKMIDHSLHNFSIGAKSAYIAGLIDGPEAGMRWLGNLLFGPGLLPSDEEIAMGPQAFSDANYKA